MIDEVHPIAVASPRAMFFRRVVDVLLPPRCLLCRVLVHDHGHLCGDCWTQIDFIETPFCAKCGISLPFDVGAGGQCGSCLSNPPLYDQARSVFTYDDVSRDLVLRFKHGDQLQAVRTFAPWLARVGQELLDQADFLVPVPLHWIRRVRRRYNQSAILAQGMEKLAGVAYRPDILRRHRRTRSQGVMKRKDREKNVKNAFVVGGDVQGKVIVLVDDVLTSGATVNECARALKQAGAKQVRVITLARVGAARL